MYPLTPQIIAASLLLCAGVTYAQQQSVDPVEALGAQAEQAAQRAAADTLEPHEINMIEWRRTFMGQPGLQLYVVFFNDMGQPVEYFVTDGKCTSSGKRLRAGVRVVQGKYGEDSDGHTIRGDFFLPAPAIDGTHGHSDPYIYCKTVDGKYKQWNGRYYVSGSPVELTVKPLMVDLSGAVQTQQ